MCLTQRHPVARSEVSDTGRFTRSVSAAALLWWNRVSDTGGSGP